VVRIGDRRRAGAERDAALARMSRARRVVTMGTLGLAAAFTAMADGATPSFNKQRGAAAARAGHPVVIRPSTAWPHPKRHHRRKHRPRAAPSTAAPSTTAPSAPAPAPAPAAPPAAPAPTQQAPATTSGGS
jgi:hypothetical protein